MTQPDVRAVWGPCHCGGHPDCDYCAGTGTKATPVRLVHVYPDPAKRDAGTQTGPSGCGCLAFALAPLLLFLALIGLARLLGLA